MQLSKLALTALVSLVYADDPPSCGPGNLCPEKYPCCTSEGKCGNGLVCLGGCDPRYSNSPASCMAMPICQNQNYTLSDASKIANNTEYMGDPDKYPLQYSGQIKEVNGKIRAIITEDSPSSIIALNRYIWYGKVTIDLKCSHGDGLVSDFILLSDNKDEIDYEMVGSKLTQAQTNYYWQGVLNYQNMIGADVDNVYENTLTYTIDWQEDHIDWIINGKTVRTLNREDTKNQTTGEYAFPQTPSRIQFGVWSAGDSPYQGTANWAGGKVDWNTPDITGDPGYYYVEVGSVSVQCYDPPQGTTNDGQNSYIYTDAKAMQQNVALSANDTRLLSLDGTGIDPCGSQDCPGDDDGDSSSSASASDDGGAVLTGGGASSTASSDDSTDSGDVLTGGGASSTSADDSSATDSGEVLTGGGASSTADASGSGDASASGDASGDASGSGDSSASATGGSSGSASAGASGSGSAAAASGGSSRGSQAAASASGSAAGSTGAGAANAAAMVGAAALFAPIAVFL